jgi:hypothetical protein
MRLRRRNVPFLLFVALIIVFIVYFLKVVA